VVIFMSIDLISSVWSRLSSFVKTDQLHLTQ
jgi:hypothetical protein